MPSEVFIDVEKLFDLMYGVLVAFCGYVFHRYSGQLFPTKATTSEIDTDDVSSLCDAMRGHVEQLST